VSENFEAAKRLLIADPEQYFPDGERRGVEWWWRRRAEDDHPSCHIVGDGPAVKDFGDGSFRGTILDCYAEVHGITAREAAEELAGHASAGQAVTAGAGRGRGRPPKVRAVMPVPAEVMPGLNAMVKRFSARLGDAVLGSRYCNADGGVMFCIVRFEGPRGKEIRPFFFGEDGAWQSGQPMESGRPLLHLPELLADPDARVLLVEGELKCEATRHVLAEKGFQVVTWCGGSSAVDRTDWAPLAGRDVTVWPDFDAPGLKAARSIRCRLPHAEILDIANAEEPDL
jgi:putative DNA primase/helicase